MKINKYKLLIVLLTFFFIGCKKELVNSDCFIRNLSNDIDFDLPLYNESLMIFINKNNSIYITTLRQLYFIKENKYNNYKDFDSFLIDALNGDLLSEHDLSTGSFFEFKLNNNIQNEFNGGGLDYLKKMYCEFDNNNDRFYLRNNLSLNYKNNIMYFFFKNNYYVLQDDYIGRYILIDMNPVRRSVKWYSD